MSLPTDSLAALLASMVHFDTVNTALSGKPAAEQALAEHLEQHARAVGLQPSRLSVAGQGFNLLLTHEVNAGSPWLLFESHMDTVGVEGMVGDPFAATVRDGRMHGRGVCDTKGSGAAMLWALQTYAHWSDGPNNVALLFTVDEEISKTGIRRFVKNDLPTLGWRPEGAIVGEPTQLKLVSAHKGVVRWTIRTQGRAAHSSDPSKGQSAISMMVKVIQALESRYIPSLQRSHPLAGQAACSINQMRGGSQINIIPASAEIQIDRRTVPGECGEQVLAEVEAVLERLRREDPTLRVQQEPPFVDPPLDPATGPWYGAWAGAVLDALGLDGRPIGVGYGSDASDFSGGGIPALLLGPGDIAQAHTADEWLELAELEQAAEIYLQLMQTPLPVEAR